MEFTHSPLTDAAATEERRSLLRASDARPRRVGPLRQAPVAAVLAFTFGAAFVVTAGPDLVHGTNEHAWLALSAVALAALCGGWFVSAHLHDSSASEAASAIRATYAEASDGELNYLVAMKGEYPEIGHAVRQWMALSLTIRTRDIRAVRAWVTRVEPLRERSRLLSKLAD